MKKFLCTLFVLFCSSVAFAQNSGTVTNHAYAIGKGAGVTGYTSLLCSSGQLAVGQATDPICRTVSGDWTLNAAGVATLATVNGNVGTFGSATQCIITTQNAKGLTTAISAATCTPAIGSITGLGTGVATTLGLNVGSAGAPVTFNGAGGTPSAIALANGTGLPLTTGVTGTLPVANGGTGASLSKLAWSATPPTVNSGFCTSPSISNNNGTVAFTITIGSACAASTGVLTMPAASVGWACNFRDVTNNAANAPSQTASTTTTVSVTNYVRTTGVAGNWTASDVIVADCTAY